MFNVTSFVMTLEEHYSLSCNVRHKHRGTLWEGRYHARESKPVTSDMSPILAYIDCSAAESDIRRNPDDYEWCGFAAACEGDELARRACRFAYGNEEDPWEVIAEFHRIAIRKRLGEIEEEPAEFGCASVRRGGTRLCRHGNAYGSNIFNIAMILGLAVLIFPLVVRPAESGSKDKAPTERSAGAFASSRRQAFSSSWVITS